VVESLGHERHIICDVSTDDFVIVRVPADAPVPRVGAAIGLTTAPAHLPLFDASTTRRIN
jgi:hypothetical protein